MKVVRIMNQRPVTVHEETDVRTAVGRLADHEITMMPVVDGGGRILGVVAEGDLLGTDAERVSDVMHRTTVLVHPETDLAEVDRVLHETGVKSVPVVDASDQVVGMVSRSDLVRMAGRGDDLLQEEIIDALCAAHLRGWRVAVHHGLADLSGTAAEEPERARQVAGDVLGVRAVRVS